MMRTVLIAAAAASFAAGAIAHPGHDAPPPPDHMYDAVGVFLKWDASKRAADIAYEYNDRLGWPSMRMTFAVAPEVDLSKLQPKTRVQFMLHQTPTGAMIVVQMCPTAFEKPIAGHCGATPEGHDGHGAAEGHEAH